MALRGVFPRRFSMLKCRRKREACNLPGRDQNHPVQAKHKNQTDSQHALSGWQNRPPPALPEPGLRLWGHLRDTECAKGNSQLCDSQTIEFTSFLRFLA